MTLQDIIAQHQAKVDAAAEQLGVSLDPIEVALLVGGLVCLRQYAWWVDGKQRVGCGVYSLDQAERDWIVDVCTTANQQTTEAKQ